MGDMLFKDVYHDLKGQFGTSSFDGEKHRDEGSIRQSFIIVREELTTPVNQTPTINLQFETQKQQNTDHCGTNYKGTVNYDALITGQPSGSDDISSDLHSLSSQDIEDSALSSIRIIRDQIHTRKRSQDLSPRKKRKIYGRYTEIPVPRSLCNQSRDSIQLLVNMVSCWNSVGQKPTILADFNVIDYHESSMILRTSSAGEERAALAEKVKIPDIQSTYQCQNSTLPFMAIEASGKQKFTVGVPFHLCHELESVLYALVWHVVDKRPKENTTRDNRKRHKEDALERWKVGTCADVGQYKHSFLLYAPNVLKSSDHRDLLRISFYLREPHRVRHMAISEEENDAYLKKIAPDKWDKFPRQQTIRSMWGTDVKLDSSVAIFPALAQALQLEGKECKKDCCQDLGVELDLA